MSVWICIKTCSYCTQNIQVVEAPFFQKLCTTCGFLFCITIQGLCACFNIDMGDYNASVSMGVFIQKPFYWPCWCFL